MAMGMLSLPHHPQASMYPPGAGGRSAVVYIKEEEREGCPRRHRYRQAPLERLVVTPIEVSDMHAIQRVFNTLYTTFIRMDSQGLVDVDRVLCMLKVINGLASSHLSISIYLSMGIKILSYSDFFLAIDR